MRLLIAVIGVVTRACHEILESSHPGAFQSLALRVARTSTAERDMRSSPTWLHFALLGTAVLTNGCSRASVPDRAPIEGSYYLPLSANYQNTMSRAWAFSEGRVIEEMIDRHQTVHASSPVGSYAAADTGYEGVIEGRRYRLSPGTEEGDMGITLVRSGQEPITIHLRRRTTAHGELVPTRRAKASRSTRSFR